MHLCNVRQAATDSVGTDMSLLCSSGMTSRLSCESVLQMLAQNKAILLWFGNLGKTTVWAIVSGFISMLQTVDSPDINFICICNDLNTLTYS